MKSRKYEKGQALAEMVVGLVGLMTVFLGMLFVAAMGIENIETLLGARGGADENSCNGFLQSQGVSIANWGEYGDDGFCFTADDEETLSQHFSFNPKLFQSELDAVDPSSGVVLCEAEDLEKNYVTGNNMANYAIYDGYLFFFAAELTSACGSERDALAERNLEDLRGAFEGLLGSNPDFNLSEQRANRVYMPLAR